MKFTGLISLYGLLCLSMIGSIILAGFSISPAFAYFEKRDGAETARKKSLAVAFGLWMFFQIIFCLLIFLLDPQLLV